MKLRALAATAGCLALVGWALPAAAAPATRHHHARHTERMRWPFDHHTCFEGPVAKDHTKPGGACWAGGICLNPATAIFYQGDTGVWCMGQRRRNPKHPAEGLVTTLRNEATKDHEFFVVDLVGYVTYDPGNPIPGHALWPFRNPTLDQAFDHAPVVNLVFVPGGKITHSIRIQCVNDDSLSANKPASFGRCSKEEQFGHDLHDSYFVWIAPEHRIEAVHLTNTEEHSHKVFCLFADSPAGGPAPWYIRLVHPLAPVGAFGVLQFWYERHIA